MPHASLVFYWPEDFDVGEITKDDIRVAAWLKLPFRFRTGPVFQIVMDAEEGIDLWICNRVSVPEGEPNEVTLQRRFDHGRSDWDALRSEAVMIFRHPKVNTETIDKIKKGDDCDIPAADFPYFRALETLNEFTCAYVTATKELFGGASLRPLSDTDFFNSALYAQATLLCPIDYVIGQTEIAEILQWTPERELKIGSMLVGELSDLPKNRMDFTSSLDKIRSHAFYELVFKAKAEMGPNAVN